MKKLTVLDIFCGAGGFSEGFRQQDFEIKLGIDSWKPAIDTYNHNFDLACPIKNILDFEYSVEEIELLPDTDVIIGSPPCITFSSSNISGKANKKSGIHLTKILLRIVAVKKYKKNSILKAWFMENVANSKNYLSDYYTFKDLGLTKWANEHRLSPNKKAIILKDNQPLINSADYGSPQKRIRAIPGEIINKGNLSIPTPTYKDPCIEGKRLDYLTLGSIKKKLPKPNSIISTKKIQDPIYPNINIKMNDITDHFYDTGLYACEWRQSRFLKKNHPYMGKMHFPENELNPSRTITATKIRTSREAIIYRSEFDRIGDGEFRIPTVREAASLMGFPITFQFMGSEGIKWRLVGNAVCPSVSCSFAKQLRIELKLKPIEEPIVQTMANLKNVNNLNNYSEKTFNNLPRRKRNSRFRRHPFKDGNLTITLSNYDIKKNEKEISIWRTSVQYGNGEGFPTYNYSDGMFKELESLIKKCKAGEKFLDIINNGISEKIGSSAKLQAMYENQKSNNSLLEPTELIEEIANIIDTLTINNEEFVQNDKVIFKNKKVIPIKQLFALYAINKISTIANG